MAKNLSARIQKASEQLEQLEINRRVANGEMSKELKEFLQEQWESWSTEVKLFNFRALSEMLLFDTSTGKETTYWNEAEFIAKFGTREKFVADTNELLESLQKQLEEERKLK